MNKKGEKERSKIFKSEDGYDVQHSHLLLILETLDNIDISQALDISLEVG